MSTATSPVPGYAYGSARLARAPYTTADLAALQKALLFTQEDVEALRQSKSILAQWRLQGTPSTLLLDRQGRLRLHHFGAPDELHLGVAIGRLLAQPPADRSDVNASAADVAACADGACAIGR